MMAAGVSALAFARYRKSKKKSRDQIQLGRNIPVMKNPTLVILGLASTLAAGGETVPEVPPPSTYLMMVAGIGALALAKNRKSRKK